MGEKRASDREIECDGLHSLTGSELVPVGGMELKEFVWW